MKGGKLGIKISRQTIKNGCWFDKKGELVVKDGIAQRAIKEGEILYGYGKNYLYLEDEQHGV